MIAFSEAKCDHVHLCVYNASENIAIKYYFSNLG